MLRFSPTNLPPTGKIDVMSLEFWPEGVDRKEIEVPRLHASPAEDSSRLVYGLMPARNPKGLPPVFFLCGGPGDSAINWLNHPPFREVFEAASESLDLIFLDQRGCGRSEPGWKLGPISPACLASREAAEKALEAQVASFVATAPDFDPRVLTPVESALDILAIAEEEGFGSVSLWGYSYGTHLAMAALKLFPERVSRVALCGFEGPNQTWKLPQQAEDCLGKRGVLDSFRRALVSLDEAPLDLGDGVVVGSFGLRWMTASWFGVASQATRLEKRFAACWNREDAGLMEELRKGVKGFLRVAEKPLAFYCKDLASGATADRLSELAGDGPFGDDLNFPFPWMRTVIPQVDLGDDYRLDARFEGPVFVLTGGMDGFTPTSNVAEQGGSMPRLLHRVGEGLAHDQLLGDSEIVKELIGFLAS